MSSGSRESTRQEPRSPGSDRTSGQAPRERGYQPPRLHHLGDLRGLTLGGSVIDVGDSQFPNTRP